MKEKELTVDRNLIKLRITAMLHMFLRRRPMPKIDEPAIEIEFSEKELLATIFFSCPWLREIIEECMNDIEFGISSAIKDAIQDITGKKEDA